MRQYVIDELRLEDYQQLKEYLDAHFKAPECDGLYWIPIDTDLLNPIQKDHADCHPHVVGFELMEDRLAVEFLIRTRNRIRCDCIGYADRQQRQWIMDTADAMMERLNLIT